MSTPLAIGATASLAAAAEPSRRKSRSKLSTTDKARIIELFRAGRVDKAQELSESLGEERLDLSGVDFSGADLYEVSLHEADLCEADLSKSDLRGAYLTGAELREVNLTGADLSGAWMTGADLQGANLTGADLSFAILRDADLTGANLTGATLHGACLIGAFGIDLGPDRAFKKIPDGYRVQRSRLSGRDYGLIALESDKQ